jgi:hypothetical protein
MSASFPSAAEIAESNAYLVAAAGLVPFRTLQDMWYVMRFKSLADFAALPDDLEWAPRIGCYSAQDLLAARDAVRNLLSAVHEMAWTTQADSRG